MLIGSELANQRMGGKAAATLAVVEAVGPARLALTVAATPKVSEKAREYQVVRDLLAVCARAARRAAWRRVRAP